MFSLSCLHNLGRIESRFNILSDVKYFTVDTAPGSQWPWRTGEKGQWPLRTGVKGQLPWRTGVRGQWPWRTGVKGHWPWRTGFRGQWPWRTVVKATPEIVRLSEPQPKSSLSDQLSCISEVILEELQVHLELVTLADKSRTHQNPSVSVYKKCLTHKLMLGLKTLMIVN